MVPPKNNKKKKREKPFPVTTVLSFFLHGDPSFTYRHHTLHNGVAPVGPGFGGFVAGGETDIVDIFVVDTGIFRGHSFHDLSIPPNKKKSQRKCNHQKGVYSRLHRWFKRNGTVFGGFEKIELLDTIK